MSLTLRHAALYTPASGTVTVADRAGSVRASGGHESALADVVVFDRPTPALAHSTASILAVDRILNDLPGSAFGSVTTDNVISGVTDLDLADAILASGPGQILLIDQIFIDNCQPVAASGTTDTLAAGGPPSIAVYDRPGSVQAFPVGTAVRIGRILTDYAVPASAAGLADYAASAVFVTDHSSAIWAQALAQHLAIDRTLGDAPRAVTATGTAEVVVTEQLPSTVVFDHPDALFAGLTPQIVVLDIIRVDHPGLVTAGRTSTQLIGGSVVTDLGVAVMALGGRESVVVIPILEGWPPLVTGPFYEPLISVTPGFYYPSEC